MVHPAPLAVALADVARPAERLVAVREPLGDQPGPELYPGLALGHRAPVGTATAADVIELMKAVA